MSNNNEDNKNFQGANIANATKASPPPSSAAATASSSATAADSERSKYVRDPNDAPTTTPIPHANIGKKPTGKASKGGSDEGSKTHRKTPVPTLELRAKILAELKIGKPPSKVAQFLGLAKSTVHDHIKVLKKTGHLTPEDEVAYNKNSPSTNNRDWYKIMKTTKRELPFYIQEELVATARKMAYRLIELTANARAENPNITTYELNSMGLPDLGDPKGKDYKKRKGAFIDAFYTYSAEARKGVDSTYTKPSNFPKLPIDCFVDETRKILGETAMNEPSDPTPAEAPEDPIEYTENVIQELKDAILDYDGACERGDDGVMPGRWYKQPIYVEIWCESDAIQRDFLKYQEGRKNIIAPMKGFQSTRGNIDNCRRLKEMVETYDYIKKIVILYFGDSDTQGNEIAQNVEAALMFYHGGGTLRRHISFENDEGELEERDEELEILASQDLCIPLNVEVEFRHVAITPEQVKKYNLTGYQMEAFTTLKSRIKVFKKIVTDAIDSCWDEDIYNENCPDEEYNYEANGIEEPEDIDIDELYYDPLRGEYTGKTILETMADNVTKAFPMGWERVELERRKLAEGGG